MHFELTIQKYNSSVVKECRCHMSTPSSLIKILASQGYHVHTYHQVPKHPNDIIRIEVGKGDPNEIEQSRKVC